MLSTQNQTNPTSMNGNNDKQLANIQMQNKNQNPKLEKRKKYLKIEN
jgi:hypothetical protein